MSSRWRNRHGGNHSGVIAVATAIAGLSAFLVVAGDLHADAAAISSPADAPNLNGSVQTDAGTMPVFKLVEGAKGSPNPYTPRVLRIPAGQKVVVEITNHLGDALW